MASALFYLIIFHVRAAHVKHLSSLPSIFNMHRMTCIFGASTVPRSSRSLSWLLLLSDPLLSSSHFKTDPSHYLRNENKAYLLLLVILSPSPDLPKSRRAPVYHFNSLVCFRYALLLLASRGSRNSCNVIIMDAPTAQPRALTRRSSARSLSLLVLCNRLVANSSLPLILIPCQADPTLVP
ncbi:hypothetical protein CC85DRAFT_127048 [Cutaneotrichosporon oleaginosum]|uniref:Secreted protein n=1 Tax=Cutaneotrichosporon oleaginosum TaxID=879819 RepID=A0A0J0XJA3_9TREE|nr:uncharacterized protein CC85DRAFT_127048 [Cutaneotrichosporon oleaginosum]KLT41148.1 hypothetical protein CC85DRAFT_127048 [Cutaneotrichosporon oleaginosum]TXT14134.1 hypothetical protein COLE_00327 [Cutaneotrichosporon oleaginosum]